MKNINKKSENMKGGNKRVTIYLRPEFHRALRVKAAETEYTVSKIVNDAVKIALAEDAIDLEAFEARKDEPSYDFEEVVKALKRDGKL
jgi:thiamine monophosphate synthase